MNKLLSVNHLSKVYYNKKDEIEAIKDISFDLYEGEFVSIVGPSGCGKSKTYRYLKFKGYGQEESFHSRNRSYNLQYIQPQIKKSA